MPACYTVLLLTVVGMLAGSGHGQSRTDKRDGPNSLIMSSDDHVIVLA
jgi:hypothetical protein